MRAPATGAGQSYVSPQAVCLGGSDLASLGLGFCSDDINIYSVRQIRTQRDDGGGWSGHAAPRGNLSSRPGPPPGEPHRVLVSWLGRGVASGPPRLPVYHPALGSSRSDPPFLQSNSNGRDGPSGLPQAGAGRWDLCWPRSLENSPPTYRRPFRCLPSSGALRGASHRSRTRSHPMQRRRRPRELSSPQTLRPPRTFGPSRLPGDFCAQ